MAIIKPGGDISIGEPFQSDVFKDRKGDRQKFAKTLNKLLGKIDSNYVLNINSSWGTGKTYFLEEWQKMLQNDNNICIYFNAWKNDHYENAFNPLFGCLAKGLPKTNRAIYNKIVKGGGKIILAACKGAVANYIGNDVFDVTTEVVGNEIINNLTKESNTLNDFKESLAICAKENGKIFIFVDELDRCRPTFAVEVLEKIKHFFDIDNVIFVIATDNDQLSATVKHFYGESFSGNKYLDRFFDQNVKLPLSDNYGMSLYLCEKYEIPKSDFLSNLENQVLIGDPDDRNLAFPFIFSQLATIFGLDIRTQHKCFARIHYILNTNTGKSINEFIISLLVIMNIAENDFFMTFSKTAVGDGFIARLKINGFDHTNKLYQAVNKKITYSKFTLDIILLKCNSLQINTEIYGTFDLVLCRYTPLISSEYIKNHYDQVKLCE